MAESPGASNLPHIPRVQHFVTRTVLLWGIGMSACGITNKLPRFRAIALIVTSAACQAAPVTEQLEISMDSSPGHVRVRLSQSLNSLATREGQPTLLRPDLVIGGSAQGFAIAGDVAETAGDTVIALSDRIAAAIFMYGPGGGPIAQFGRKGDGPGEFRDPIAITSFGDHLAVLDGNPARPLTTLDARTGRVLATRHPGISGDWSYMFNRRPFNPVDMPASNPLEDLSLRLQPAGDTTFLVYLQPDERAAAMADTSRPDIGPAVIVRMTRALGVVDTPAVLQPVASHGTRPLRDDQWPEFRQEVFVPRPIWAASNDMLALGHTDSATIVVRSLASDRDTLATIRWPEQGGVLGESDQLEYARWQLLLVVRQGGQFAERWGRLTPRERREMTASVARREAFASRVPQIMVAHFSGRCLFMAGFAPADGPSATAATWLVVNPFTGSHGLFRFPRSEVRVRTVSTRFFWATRYTDAGAQILERYPHGVECSR